MDFKSGQQLIGLCETNECPISEIMLIREETFTERTRKDIINQMGKTWQIMKESAHSSVENPSPSRYNRACIIGKYQASGREETPLA